MAMVLHCSTAVSLDVKSSSIIQHLYTCYLCSYNIINSVRDLQINLYTNILNHLDMYKKKRKRLWYTNIKIKIYTSAFVY